MYASSMEIGLTNRGHLLTTPSIQVAWTEVAQPDRALDIGRFEPFALRWPQRYCVPIMLRAFILFATLAVFATPALAQEFEQAEEPAPPRNAPIELVVDLAETLGRAHAVRTLCNGDTDSTWRNYMLNLMSYEAPGGDRRASLTDAFNRGYRGQNRETSSCTPGMPAIEAGIARRGRELSEAIARTYLN